MTFSNQVKTKLPHAVYTILAEASALGLRLMSLSIVRVHLRSRTLNISWAIKETVALGSIPGHML